MSELNKLVEKIKQRWSHFPNATEASLEKPTSQVLIRFFEFFVDDYLSMLMELTKTEANQSELGPQVNSVSTEVYFWFLTNQLFRYKVTTITLDDIIQPAPVAKRIRSLMGVCLHFLEYVSSKLEDNVVYDLFDKHEKMSTQTAVKGQLIETVNELAEAIGRVDDELLAIKEDESALKSELVEAEYNELKTANADAEAELRQLELELANVEAGNLKLSEEFDRLQSEVVVESSVNELETELSELKTQNETYHSNNSALLEVIRGQKVNTANLNNVILTISKLELQRQPLDILNKELDDVKNELKTLNTLKNNLEADLATQQGIIQEKLAVYGKLKTTQSEHRDGIKALLEIQRQQYEKEVELVIQLVKEKNGICEAINEAQRKMDLLKNVFETEYGKILMSQKNLFASSLKYKSYFG